MSKEVRTKEIPGSSSYMRLDLQNTSGPRQKAVLGENAGQSGIDALKP